MILCQWIKKKESWPNWWTKFLLYFKNVNFVRSGIFYVFETEFVQPWNMQYTFGSLFMNFDYVLVVCIFCKRYCVRLEIKTCSYHLINPFRSLTGSRVICTPLATDWEGLVESGTWDGPVKRYVGLIELKLPEKSRWTTRLKVVGDHF